jgi:Protein of unknown function (DUF3048) N-terminal domain/Protein of unknown function (DUF3048) C-terminal domain
MSQSRNRILLRLLPPALLLLTQACNLAAPQGNLAPGTVSGATPDAGMEATLTAAAASPAVTAASETTDTPTATFMPITYPIGPSGFPANVDPLTGLPVADPQLLDRRPLAIKVSNYPRTARPQWGLSRADLLWEFVTEYGATRWIAMYYGQDAEKVGPIRSARVLDTRIVPLYDAILVHVQADESVWREMSLSGIDDINEFPASCPAICRDETPGIEEENSAIGNTIELTKYAKRVGLLSAGKPNLDGMIFDPAMPAGADPSIGVHIFFSGVAIVEWKYDPAGGRYWRSSEVNNAGTMGPLLDKGTGAQLAVDNVLVLVVNIKGYEGKKGTGEQYDMDLSTAGKGYFFRDGVMVEGQWQSGGPASPLRFVDQNGQPFALHPGITYISILGLHALSDRWASTEWYFSNYY